MKACGIVTLLSDFGLADGYVAAMKGVLLGLAPRVTLVDVSHLIAAHDVVAGAFVLASAEHSFPSGTVHLAVVDPGVGSRRAAIAVETDRAWLVGPDNGLLALALRRASRIRAVRIEAERLGGDPSPTFHGRDLFAPAAARLVLGAPLEELGPPHHPLADLGVPQAVVEGASVHGEAIHVDRFGNLITNIDAALLPGRGKELLVEIGPHRIEQVVDCYADAAPGSACALIGSEGLLEVAVREGSAAEVLGGSRGARVVVRKR